MPRSRCLHGTFTASRSPHLLLPLLSLGFRLYAFTGEYYTGAGDLRGASIRRKNAS